MKFILRNYRLLIPIFILIVIIVLFPVFFPSVSHSVYMKTGVQPAKYYTLISVTLVALIPVLTGIIFGRLTADKTHKSADKISTNSIGNIPDSAYVRIFTSLLISFILIIFSIWLIKPVPSQGWLRTIYAAGLLSVQAPFVLVLLMIAADKKFTGPGLNFYWVFLITLPLGLLVHHPWNYFAFFSPFYWIAWAWMITAPLKAVICGSIALILSAVFLFLVMKFYPKRQTA